MTNGGSDCCASCWFNIQNDDPGMDYTRRPDAAFCTIRDFRIEDPQHTYCVNHPIRSPEKGFLPIGPVFVSDSSWTRHIWKPSEDSEDIRKYLLSLLRQIDEEGEVHYHWGMSREDVVIWQLGDFRETRAIPDLERIAHFEQKPMEKSTGLLQTNRSLVIGLATQALKKIRSRSKNQGSRQGS